MESNNLSVYEDCYDDADEIQEFLKIPREELVRMIEEEEQVWRKNYEENNQRNN